MRRPKGPGQSEAKSAQQRLLFLMTGDHDGVQPWQWDPKEAQLVEAILWVLSQGAALLLRPGSGGRSVGIAIWEGDTRHPPKWCYDAEEVDEWSAKIIAMKRDQAGK